MIYDYEFLENPAGLNVGAAMSPFAGFVGAAVAVRTWCHQRLAPGAPLAPVRVSTKEELCEELRRMVDEVKAQASRCLPAFLPSCCSSGWGAAPSLQAAILACCLLGAGACPSHGPRRRQGSAAA